MSQSQAPFMFITDLDNTLVGETDALAELNDHLDQHRQNHGTIIVYSTGRSLTLYRQLLTEEILLEPDFLVLSVGTVIYPKGSQTPHPDWIRYLSPGWDRDQVVAIAQSFAELTPQAQSEQTQFKASYTIDGETAKTVLPQLHTALQEANLDTQLIYSDDQDLDILPQRGDKGAAVAFLQQQVGMGGDRTVVCGDSGNDIAMFEAATAKGIIVGNAKPELRAWYKTQATTDTYLSEAHCAGGILEGLRHFHFLN
ncbi:MAG: sucrose-phosphate phosphatase [Elainellaceae cyanobacterium]